MTREMRSGRPRIAGPVLIVAGSVLGFVLLLQPWASWEDDDSSAGCPVPADQMTWHTIGWALILTMVVGGIALVMRSSPR